MSVIYSDDLKDGKFGELPLDEPPTLHNPSTEGDDEDSTVVAANVSTEVVSQEFQGPQDQELGEKGSEQDNGLGAQPQPARQPTVGETARDDTERAMREPEEILTREGETSILVNRPERDVAMNRARKPGRKKNATF